MIVINHFILDTMTSVENTNYTKHKTNKIDSIIKTKYNQVLNDLIDINNNSNLSNQRKVKEFSNIAISCMVYLKNSKGYTSKFN